MEAQTGIPGGGGGSGMEGDLKVKDRHARAHTHSLSEPGSVGHQSLLDMLGGHTSKRFTL